MVFNLCHAESHLSCAISVSLQQLGQHSPTQKRWGGGLWFPSKPSLSLSKLQHVGKKTLDKCRKEFALFPLAPGPSKDIKS